MAALQPALKPLLEEVGSLTEKIHACEKRIEQIARTRYPETERVRQVSGVGILSALTFVLMVIRAKAGRSWESAKAASICASGWC